MRTPPTLNIGILAHVDAGKTSLTERLLFDTGAIGRLGSVDAGTTRTDTGAVERRRGITVRTAVASFTTGGLRVNLIDTPGHGDFTAEVERALGVLDAAVLVLSAVEGVQARTRVLMKTLRRLGLPTMVFVNKTDRTGAREDATLAAIRARLTPRVLPMATVRDIGTPDARTVPHSFDDPAFRERVAEALAEDDDGVLAELVDGRVPDADRLRAGLAGHTARGLLHPVYFGSALSGQGIDHLLDGVARWLPPARGELSGEPRGTVFAVERAASGSGEKTAYLRLFSGTLDRRDRVTLHRREPDGTLAEHGGRVTGLDVAGGGHHRLTPGGIAAVRGLPAVRVGDRLGPVGDRPEAVFAPPTLESVVRPSRPADASRLHAALAALADQDPLIATRPLPDGAGTSVLLYGEVQKEVLAATLAEEFGVEAVFEESRPVFRERPAGTGAAYEGIDRRTTAAFWATVGLRVEPGTPGSGTVYRRETELGALPLGFDRAIEETVRRTLQQGLYGWPVTDIVVTLTHSGYASPVSTGTDFRRLTPLVLMRALAEAGTAVYEPCHAYELEVPADALSAATGLLAGQGATVGDTVPATAGWLIRGVIPARRVAAVERRLPGAARGEAVWWSAPTTDRPLSGTPQVRERSGADPLNRAEYLRSLGRA
ncbi:TetM/TetW/TetO/TetS family tetracycline resistance ribosomal protection protein [Streptomyces sp. AV19]|uniref:elongation factor G n=1 Tax=Streptomyces sp. AV19 TaxID=2793068 RepID=UPI0018FE7DB7|nr:TetM/TetW/TetO/TetS family tetracycline resistance ribosomal protection protein [Streptomyces sp. AV19]MBH1938413.1 TetM/TetW/TetO/TetS family tetracycline resistance ribosomal protection protein [Streptomyces sp. AV19]MDG4535062.1 TetM/TetW/TetO/TetS family tetracycline resistance ribosomal protection protein [Streptomyces sp. AV19]